MCGKLPHVETLSNPDNYSLNTVECDHTKSYLNGSHMDTFTSCVDIGSLLLNIFCERMTRHTPGDFVIRKSMTKDLMGAL